MYVVITAFCIFLLIGVVVIYVDGFRLAKTLWLIVSIEPYEQFIPDAPRILIFGDSTGYGTGARLNTNTIAGRIGADFPSYTIVNTSVNGQTIKDALLKMKELPEAKAYTLILLQLGGNDILQKRPLASIKAELALLLAEATNRAEHVVLMTSGNVGGAPVFKGKQARDYEMRTRELRTVSMELSTQAGVHYVDLFLEPAVDIVSQNPKRYLALDGLHPSDEGYGVWYEKLEPVLRELLQ